jgi:5-enolpyruvylshikimate-3-phosphate synthase
VLPAPADHRVVMALALLGTVCRGGVALPHPEAVAKSWPDYFAWLARIADVRFTAPEAPGGSR